MKTRKEKKTKKENVVVCLPTLDLFIYYWTSKTSHHAFSYRPKTHK